MTSIFDPSHPHYLVHRDFVEGGFANPKNPPQIEYSIPVGRWYLNLNPTWDMNTNYQIKPRMRSRTVTYPEPMREEPDDGAEVWIVLTSHEGPYPMRWDDSAFCLRMLNIGMCFRTEADAQTCYDELFGEQK